MTSPLSKLVRIAIVLLSFALLFNFFGYYFIYTHSQENEKLVEIISIASRQRMLSQSITKNVILLCNTTQPRQRKQQITDSLQKSVIEFQEKDKFLRGETTVQGLPVPPSNFEIKKLSSKSRTYVKTILAVANEVLYGDSLMLKVNGRMYTNELLYNEARFLPLMEDMVKQHAVIIETRIEDASNMNTGKFVSLVIALALLTFLVLEPLFKSNQKNYNELQEARIELIKEQKYLASILNSQTNYVVRIDREGNYKYANPQFLKTFGYEEKELIGTSHTISIFEKDRDKFQQVTCECWKNPVKI